MRVWRALNDGAIPSDNANVELAESALGNIVLIRAFGVDVEKLDALSLETLCRATTAEFARIVSPHPVTEMQEIVLSYLESIEQEVLAMVRYEQSRLLGSGCNLSPRESDASEQNGSL
jgi:hypothetical protein